jgi:hypothetical protein
LHPILHKRMKRRIKDFADFAEITVFIRICPRPIFPTPLADKVGPNWQAGRLLTTDYFRVAT